MDADKITLIVITPLIVIPALILGLMFLFAYVIYVYRTCYPDMSAQMPSLPDYDSSDEETDDFSGSDNEPQQEPSDTRFEYTENDV